MATHEDELKDLKEKNNELVQKVQYWKMTAAQRENEKLELMKEINELRLKVIRLKSGGAAEARKLDAALQRASEEALSHLVQASGAVTRTIDLAKAYMRDRQDMETTSPRWSNISNSTEKVHRVPPMMIGGQSIQPVVSLSRTLNLSAQRPVTRSPNSNRNVTVRAVPMHMLQDVYIPLTRIDMRDLPNRSETEQEAITADDNEEDIPFDNSMEEPAEESQNITDENGYDSSHRLDIVTEELEPEEEARTPPLVRVDSPLAGPSWLLEPDSTTHGDAPPRPSPEARVFTPTMRRRKREPAAESPPPSLPATGSRVLQVLVPKMQFDGASPAKRPAPLAAPSPHGATDRVIVSEELARAQEARPSSVTHEPQASTSQHDSDSRPNCPPDTDSRPNCPPDTDSRPNCQHDTDSRPNCQHDTDSRPNCQDDSKANCQHDSRRDSDSDSGTERASEGRTRRNRKPVTYKEKPLNRKLRR